MPSADGPAHGHHAPWYSADNRAVKPEIGGAFGRESPRDAVGLRLGLDDHVGGVAGGVRRGWLGRVGLRDLGGEPEVGEDGTDDVGVLDRRDEAEATATPGTGQHVDVEGVAHQMGPRPVA